MALFVVLVGYPLSIGPAYALMIEGWLHPTILGWMYCPILEPADRNPAFKELLLWYMTLFY